MRKSLLSALLVAVLTAGALVATQRPVHAASDDCMTATFNLAQAALDWGNALNAYDAEYNTYQANLALYNDPNFPLYHDPDLASELAVESASVDDANDYVTWTAFVLADATYKAEHCY